MALNNKDEYIEKDILFHYNSIDVDKIFDQE